MQYQYSCLDILIFYILLKSTLFKENLYLPKMHLGADLSNIHKNDLF